MRYHCLMDNLSHLVAGLAAGELIHRLLPAESDPERQGTRRKLLLFSGAAANNVPDLDLVLTPLLPAPLGYLLHHRGHTHTVLYAIPQAIALLMATFLLWPGARRLMQSSATALRGAIAAVTAGFLLHLSMDFLNSYGIHPFHPFDSRWYYGDMVYIVEPFFWVVFGVPLAMMVRRAVLRAVLLALPCLALGYFTLRGFLLPASLAVLAAAGIAIAIAQWRAGERSPRVIAAVFGAALAFITLQGYAGYSGRRIVIQALEARTPSARVLDVAMTSFPTNPLCWNFVSIQADEAAGSYSLRRGVTSIAPSVLGTAQCPGALLEVGGPADAADESDGQVLVLNRLDASLATLRALHRDNCHLRAWLRFIRMPALGAQAGWDLRYGTGPAHNFTAIGLHAFAGQPCPQRVPGWAFPRADLLGSQ